MFLGAMVTKRQPSNFGFIMLGIVIDINDVPTDTKGYIEVTE